MNTRAKDVKRDFLADHLKEVPAFRALIRGIECRLFEQAGPFCAPVLDIGCGDGHFASIAFDTSIQAGLDIDFQEVRLANSRESYMFTVNGTATRIPFASEHFSTVVSNCALEHIPNLDKALGEIHRVLSDEGRLLFGVPSHRFGGLLLGSTVLRKLGLKKLGKAYGNWFNSHSRHYHVYDPSAWVQRLTGHGFDVEHWEYYMTPAAHRAFDLAHYLSVPRWICWRITGKWVPIPNPLANSIFDWWLRRHYEADVGQGEGAYLFFHCRKRSG